jgi:DNA-binding NtrC family response regulator
MVREGKFREDLYYRLNVVPLKLPALRSRSGDVPKLAQVFANRVFKQLKMKKRSLGAPVLEALAAYPWPGNIRELQNVMERAVIMAGASEIEPKHLNLPSGSEVLPEAEEGLKSASASVARDREVELILGALKQEKGNRSAAARRLGITYRTILNKIQKYGL